MRFGENMRAELEVNPRGRGPVPTPRAKSQEVVSDQMYVWEWKAERLVPCGGVAKVFVGRIRCTGNKGTHCLTRAQQKP